MRERGRAWGSSKREPKPNPDTFSLFSLLLRQESPSFPIYRIIDSPSPSQVKEGYNEKRWRSNGNGEKREHHSSCVYSSALTQLCFIHGEDQVKPRIACKEKWPPCSVARVPFYMLICAVAGTRGDPSPAAPHPAAVRSTSNPPSPEMPENHRLKRNGQLHEHFVDAVSQLGRANKANPRSVKRMIGVPSRTLHHLKNHPQKYRHAMKRKPEGSTGNCEREADCSAEGTQSVHVRMRGDQTQINNGTLQTEFEVQRKLNEQIEVQRHLQLRIEAERKYLQSVLRKAQEMLASYNIDSAPMEAAEDTEQAGCTDNSCLTSCEALPDGNDDKPCKQESSEDCDDISSGVEKPIENLVGGKPGGSTGYSTCEGNYAQGLPGSANSHSHQRKNYYRVSDEIDQNRDPAFS